MFIEGLPVNCTGLPQDLGIQTHTMMYALFINSLLTGKGIPNQKKTHSLCIYNTTHQNAST